jgi:hypothetical protein
VKKFFANKHGLLLILIVIFGFGIRFINIDWGIDKELDNWSSYPDEPYAYESTVGFKPFSGEFNSGPWVLIKGPLYFKFLGLVSEISEVMQVKQDATDYYNYIFNRFFTLIFSLLIIILIYYFCALLFKNKTCGLIAAFSYAIFAHEIPFSTLITGDIPAIFLSLLSLYFCIQAYKNDSVKKLYLAALFSGLAVATKYNAVATIFPIIITSVFFYSKNRKLTEFLKPVLISAGIWILTLILAVPEIFLNTDIFLQSMEIQRNYQVGEFISGTNQLPGFIFYFTNIFNNGIGIVFTVLILAALIYFLKINSKKKETLIIFAYLIPYYLEISLASWITTRYALPLMPLFAIFIGFLLFDLYQKAGIWKKYLLVLFLVVYLYNMAFLYNFLDMIKQPLVQEQFEEFRENNLKLSKNNADITFIVSYLDMFSHPVKVSYPANILYMKDIEKDPNIKIPTKYVLVSSYNIRDYRRVDNKKMVAFLDRLEKSDEFKLVKTFEKKPKLLKMFGENIYYSVDLELFFQKYYLYENTQSQINT